MVSISVIVPVHNGGEAFLECLRSVKRWLRTADEIIVVADGESDGVWRQAYSHGARVVVSTVQRGPAAARNLGAHAAVGEVLLFIDSDVTVKPDTIALVRNAFQEDPELAALFGSYDDEPGETSFLSRYRNLLHHFTHQQSNQNACTFWAACGAIRTSVFRSSGWFDESYKTPCVEDIELGYRLTSAGFRITLRKDVQVKHLKQWRPVNMIRTDLFARAIPWTELIFKYHSLRNDLNLRFESRVSVLLVFTVLAAVLISTSFPWLLSIAGLLSVALFVLNMPFYRFIASKHGVVFALASIPWHWLFFAYGGLGFLIGAFRHGRRRLFQRHSLEQSSLKSTSEATDSKSSARWAGARA